MFKIAKTFIAVIILIALGGGVFMASGTIYDDFKMELGDPRWQTKYNSLVDAVYRDIGSLCTLIINWSPVENILTLVPGTPTYVDGDTFTLSTNELARFPAGAVVQARVAAATVESTVASSSYGAGVTTVNLNNAVLTNPITRVYVVATRPGLFPYGNGEVNALDYALGTPSQVGLQAAINALGVSDRTLLMPSGSWPISSQLNVPANINLKIEKGAVLTVTIPDVPIADLSRAAACVVSWVGHGRSTGDKIYISGITQAEWTALNGYHLITKINDNSFSIPVNTSAYAAGYVPGTDPGVYSQTVAINGTVDAGLYQVFAAASGKVTLGAGSAKEIYPEWWATNTIPGTTDMAGAWQAALIAARASKIPIKSSPDNLYLINTGLTLSPWCDLTIKGNPTLKAGAAILMLNFDGLGWNPDLELILDGNNVATGGMRIGNTATGGANSGFGKLNLTISNVSGHGLEAKYCEWIVGSKLYIQNCTNTNLKLTNCMQWDFQSWWLQSGAIGLDMEKCHGTTCLDLIVGNKAGVTTSYFIKLKDSSDNKFSGWFEGEVAPTSGQVLITGNSLNNRFHNIRVNSVNTSKNFYEIGTASGTDIEGLASDGGTQTIVTWTNHPFMVPWAERVQIEGITQADWSTLLNGVWQVSAIINANSFKINRNSLTFAAYVPGTDPGTIAAVPTSNTIENNHFNANATSTYAHVKVIRGRGTQVMRNSAPISADSYSGEIDLIEDSNAYQTVFTPSNPQYDYISLSANKTLGAIHKSVLLNVASGNVTATLPDATKCIGRTYIITRGAGANIATVATTSSQGIKFGTLNVTTGLTLPLVQDYIRVRSDGAGWLLDGYMIHRSGVVAPSTGGVVPRFIGEEYEDTAAGKWYKAISPGTSSANWVALN